jgi:single-stranded DNA-binding protein
VEGKIKTNEYTDREGIRRRQITIAASRVLNLSPKEKREAGNGQNNRSTEDFGPGDSMDDFIPEFDDDVPL